MGSFPETYNDPSFGYSLITGKNNRFPFLDILGYLKNTHKNPKFGRVRQVPSLDQITTNSEYDFSMRPWSVAS